MTTRRTISRILGLYWVDLHSSRRDLEARLDALPQEVVDQQKNSTHMAAYLAHALSLPLELIQVKEL